MLSSVFYYICDEYLWWITRHTMGFLLSYAHKRSQGVNQLIWVAIQSIVEDFSNSIFKMTELLVLWCTGFLMDNFTWRTFASPCTLNNNRQKEFYVLAKLLVFLLSLNTTKHLRAIFSCMLHQEWKSKFDLYVKLIFVLCQ